MNVKTRCTHFFGTICAMAIDLEFAERLEQARRLAGFKSPRKAAEAFGWNKNTYKSRESGIRGMPPQDIVAMYARAFNVDFLWLLTGTSSEEVAARARKRAQRK